MKKFYAVIGRIPGDDDDSCYTYEVATRQEAVKAFKKDIYNDSEGSEAEDAKENIFKEYGVTVFIAHVLCSDSPIAEA